MTDYTGVKTIETVRQMNLLNIDYFIKKKQVSFFGLPFKYDNLSLESQVLFSSFYLENAGINIMNQNISRDTSNWT